MAVLPHDDGSDSCEVVLHAFGQVMLQAQYWERALLLLDHDHWLTHEHRASGDLGTPGTTAALQRQNRVLLQWTLGNIRDRLPKYLSEREIAEVTTLTGIRNVLAHRYLLQRQIDTDGDSFAPGTVDQLRHMWDRFHAEAARYMQRVSEIPDYRGTTEPHWQQTAQTLSTKLLRLGEPLEGNDLRHPDDAEPSSAL